MTKEQWQAIKNKDRKYDDKFVYVLKTTGTICRPSCDKKISLPQNVIIFDTYEEAEAAGYHPCKKCRPDQAGWMGARKELAKAVEQTIDESFTQEFSLEGISEKLHINKYHLLRTFKAVTGETPLQYHNRKRCERAMELLSKSNQSISFIAFETGFNSASHFSRVFSRVTGKTPLEFRKKCLEELDE